MPERERHAYHGHLWIFDGHVAEVLGTPGAGDLVDVYTHQKRFFGRGFYNPHSKIRVRLLSFSGGTDRRGFFRCTAPSRNGAAADSGRPIPMPVVSSMEKAISCQGWSIDRFADVAVMQTLSYGMDTRKEMLGELLVQECGVRSVYLRNDAKSRTLEGLPLSKGFLRGNGETTVEIHEGKARFTVDIAEGQKTGWFCDQRENRLAAARLRQGENGVGSLLPYRRVRYSGGACRARSPSKAWT